MLYPYEHDLVQQPFSRCSAIYREKSVAYFIRLLLAIVVHSLYISDNDSLV